MLDLSKCSICLAELPIEDGRRYIIALRYVPLCPLCGAPVRPIPLETTERPAAGERELLPVLVDA